MNPTFVNPCPEWQSWDLTLRVPESPNFSPFPCLHFWTLGGGLQRKGRERSGIFPCTLSEESENTPLWKEDASRALLAFCSGGSWVLAS